jgi:ABC-type transport system involved in multi-copper enzyme maturation permease subunit
MTSSIVRHLIRKDLHLLRGISVSALAGGLVAVGLMSLSPYPMTGGGVLLICALIVLNIFLVMHGVVQERKDQVAIFVLSLPVSPMQYVLAKVVANVIAFGVPWLVLTVATLVVIDGSQIPNGFLPLWVAVLGFVFFYYCALLSVGLLTSANGWHATAIIVGNIAVNFFIMGLFSLPSVVTYGAGGTAVWTADMFAIVGAEMVGGIAVLTLAVLAHARRTEFV